MDYTTDDEEDEEYYPSQEDTETDYEAEYWDAEDQESIGSEMEDIEALQEDSHDPRTRQLLQLLMARSQQQLRNGVYMSNFMDENTDEEPNNCVSQEAADKIKDRYDTLIGQYLNLKERQDQSTFRYITQRNVLLDFQLPTRVSLPQNGLKGQRRAQFSSRSYCGSYSADGTMFYAATQDFDVHLFDARQEEWLEKKVIAAQSDVQWTITDATLNTDNSLVAYSSITPVVHIASTDFYDDKQVAVNLNEEATGRFGIWSLKFSPDGGQLVAGTSSSSVVVYDVASENVILNIRGHVDDVNSVCFADESANVVLSGSDDTMIRVWDRRAMKRAQGCFVGHTEGITYISSRNDGRYFVSNSKDQSMKLWDMRNILSGTQHILEHELDLRMNWDYRFMSCPRQVTKRQHPHDCSVQTFRGHSVLRTLIRCGFSPNRSTCGRFLYTGSADGSVYVYSLDGQIVSKYTCSLSTQSESSVIRDVSWHPYLPSVVATSWNGMCHEFNNISM